MSKERMAGLLADAAERLPGKQVRALCLSCASFIAEIDASSSDVAAYLEQRLGPLLRIARLQGGIREFELAMQDCRKLQTEPAPECTCVEWWRTRGKGETRADPNCPRHGRK